MAMVYPLKIVSLIGFTGPAGPDKLPPCLLGCFSSQGRRLKGAAPAISGHLGALLGPHACVDVDYGRVMGLFSLTQNASDMVSTNFLLPVQASAEPSYVLLSPISLAGTGYLC